MWPKYLLQPPVVLSSTRTTKSITTTSLSLSDLSPEEILHEEKLHPGEGCRPPKSPHFIKPDSPSPKPSTPMTNYGQVQKNPHEVADRTLSDNTISSRSNLAKDDSESLIDTDFDISKRSRPSGEECTLCEAIYILDSSMVSILMVCK